MSERRRKPVQTGSQAPRTNSRRIPVQDNSSNTDITLQKKLAKIAELQNGIEILKERMTQSKQDLITYFNQNPQLKAPKYGVGEKYIRYVDKKTTDGLSQKLIILGLSDYFKSQGVKDVETEVSKALSTILSQRKSKIVPTIEVTKDRSSTSPAEIDDDDEEQ